MQSIRGRVDPQSHPKAQVGSGVRLMVKVPSSHAMVPTPRGPRVDGSATWLQPEGSARNLKREGTGLGRGPVTTEI